MRTRAVLASMLVASSAAARAPMPIGAGDDREAQRTALYRDAVKAGAAGRWAEAKERLLGVLAIRPSPKVLFSLAQSEEHLGQLASAQADYARAMERAALEGKTDVVRAAGAAERSLAARVPHLRAVLGGEPGGPGYAPSGASATLDDRPMTLGAPVAVDPGDHRLIVSAPGMRMAVVSVKVNEGQQLELSVALEADRSAQESVITATPPPLPQAIAPAPRDPPPRAGTPPDAADPGAPLRTAGLLTAGLGMLAVGAGVAFGVESIHKHDEAVKACPGAACSDPNGANLWHDAVVTGNVSTAAFLGGGVAVAAGAVLWLAAPRSNGESMRVGFGPGSVRLEGAW